MDYLDKILDFLHQQGWSYGLIRFLDQLTGEEVSQITANKGDRQENGTGRNWTEAAKYLVRKISDIPGPILH